MADLDDDKAWTLIDFSHLVWLDLMKFKNMIYLVLAWKVQGNCVLIFHGSEVLVRMEPGEDRLCPAHPAPFQAVLRSIHNLSQLSVHQVA